MAITLNRSIGHDERPSKRRRDDKGDSDDDRAARIRFQHAFEAKFKPLKRVQAGRNDDQLPNEPMETADFEESDSWNGLDDEDNDTVEIVEFNDKQTATAATRSAEARAFMSSRLPSESKQTESKKTATDATSEDNDDEMADLKNDLELQRLLKESHLLQGQSGAASTELQGKARLKALDLRIQDLGGKSSHLEQKSMPVSHRIGIQTKAAERERQRRKEAAANGVVLERAKSAAKTAAARERSIGGPTIGRFRDGMLKLSSRDVRSIESSGSNRRKKGR